MIDGQALGRSGGFGFAGGGAAAKRWSSVVPTTDGRDNPRTTVHLAAGAHGIELTASSTGTAPLSIRFAWMTPELRQANLEAAVAAARAARTAVVFAWSGMGGALALPEDQDELIRRVAAANPRTIVALNTGGPVAMPWKDGVRAILEMWYPGQEGGWATADLLLGQANPGGKLPVTFPARIEDAPARAAGHPERMSPPRPAGGANAETPAATYSEGIAVGYRWYDQRNIQPLFPFGHGLSYTRFEYSQLGVKRRGDGVDVAFTLRNAGSRRGAEVAQAYIGPPAGAPADFAPKSLAGFERVELEPGRSRQVVIHIGARALSYWSTARHDWAMPEGSREIYVGSSSRDIRLRTLRPISLTVAAQ
jgi:beta-glucosidase